MESSERTYKNYPVMGAEGDLISLDELSGWVLSDNDDWIVIDKPGWVVCHPSKNGPLSSLVGACREYTSCETLHLVSRLDRETSGVIVMAKRPAVARKLQIALQERQVMKRYLAVVKGEMSEPITVNKHLAKDLESEVAARVTVRKSNSAKKAETLFKPLATANGYSLVEVKPITGRKHQIRAHAYWLNHQIVGDKIYGPNDQLFLEFIEHGFTQNLANQLEMRRQALHATEVNFEEGPVFRAPLAWDICQFCEDRMGLSRDWLLEL